MSGPIPEPTFPVIPFPGWRAPGTNSSPPATGTRGTILVHAVRPKPRVGSAHRTMYNTERTRDSRVRFTQRKRITSCVNIKSSLPSRPESSSQQFSLRLASGYSRNLFKIPAAASGFMKSSPNSSGRGSTDSLELADLCQILPTLPKTSLSQPGSSRRASHRAEQKEDAPPGPWTWGASATSDHSALYLLRASVQVIKHVTRAHSGHLSPELRLWRKVISGLSLMVQTLLCCSKNRISPSPRKTSAHTGEN